MYQRRRGAGDEDDPRPPDFVAVGPARTGTALLRGMPCHCTLLPRNTRETQFFDSFYGKSVGWYYAHFSGDPRHKLVGEIAAACFPKPEVRGRMVRRLMPGEFFHPPKVGALEELIGENLTLWKRDGAPPPQEQRL